MTQVRAGQGAQFSVPRRSLPPQLWMKVLAGGSEPSENDTFNGVWGTVLSLVSILFSTRDRCIGIDWFKAVVKGIPFGTLKFFRVSNAAPWGARSKWSPKSLGRTSNAVGPLAHVVSFSCSYAKTSSTRRCRSRVSSSLACTAAFVGFRGDMFHP